MVIGSHMVVHDGKYQLHTLEKQNILIKNENKNNFLLLIFEQTHLDQNATERLSYLMS